MEPLTPIEPAPLPFEILRDDPPILVVNKPGGLLSVGAKPGVPTLERFVKEELKRRFSKEGNVYLGIPHRLDRPVSGVMVFTRNSKTAARMAEQFRERSVQKIYWAVLEGDPPEEQGTLEDFLRKTPDVAHVEVCSPDTEGAKLARLSYRVIARTSCGPLVEVELETGRMHQIRVQFGSRGCPIVGDVQYGAREALQVIADVIPQHQPILLHARRLSLLHPIRYDRVEVAAALPEYWPGPVGESVEGGK